MILPTRSEERARTLRREFPDAHVVVADLSDGARADALAVELRQQFSTIHHVVVSLGAWWQRGRLVDQPAEEYETVRRMLLDGHVHAARALLPLAGDLYGLLHADHRRGSVAPNAAARGDLGFEICELQR